MSNTNTNRNLIAELAAELTRQSYSPVVVRNYCAYARDFLVYFAQHEIPLTTVTPPQVAQYLRHATVAFRKRRGRPPASHWHSIPRSGIHAVLRLTPGQWPPEPDVIGPEAELRYAICRNYEAWLRDERGLAVASIRAGGAAMKQCRERVVLETRGGSVAKARGVGVLLRGFFQDWQAEPRNASVLTTRSYRDTWRLFLRFVAGRKRKEVAEIKLADLAASEVSAFLRHAERRGADRRQRRASGGFGGGGIRARRPEGYRRGRL